uniref:EGF-like domain-containing protein n=1 Tax=Cyprinodon variegatus TaxID=28743 RepID=A0A3Q2CN68_CYPVA
GRCDEQTVLDLKFSFFCVQEIQKCDLPNLMISRNSGCRPICTVNFWHPKCCPGFYGRDCLECPGGVHSLCSKRGKCDDGHLGNGTCTCEAGFKGTACELCSDGFYGPNCKACNCSVHGSCDDGIHGTGLCFCEEGWTGERCDVPIPAVLEAKCSQKGEKVSCTCLQGYSGDGFTCLPVDPCASGDNGGCHEHAICTMTAPGKKKCTCKDNYIGDGVTCELKQLPISRCLQDNGQCHPDAKCTDLHFEGTAGDGPDSELASGEIDQFGAELLKVEWEADLLVIRLLSYMCFQSRFNAWCVSLPLGQRSVQTELHSSPTELQGRGRHPGYIHSALLRSTGQ